MHISESREGPVVVIALSGRLDANTSPRLEERLLALIDGGDRRLALDLAELDYISSAGLRVLLIAAKRLRPMSGKIALATLKDHIREVFDIAGFSAMFPILASRSEAAEVAGR